MKKKLTISIAMCIYNGEKYLREQLYSIARQSRLPDELIVCDDFSSDQSVFIVEEFSASVPFPVIIFKNQTNIGSTKNFEKAITLCSGDIIVLSDQDDVWCNDKLKLIEEEFNSSIHVGAVFSNGRIINETRLFLGYTLWDSFGFSKKNKKKFLNGKAFELLLNHNFITGATMAFRSSLRNKILPISQLWVHDAWMALLLSMISNIKFIDKELIEYRRHKGQQCGLATKKLIQQITVALSAIDYSVQIKLYELIIEHNRKNKFKSEQQILLISDKIEHLRKRQNMYYKGALLKFIQAVNELMHLRYHKYSSGFKSLFKDIITTYR